MILLNAVAVAGSAPGHRAVWRIVGPAIISTACIKRLILFKHANKWSNIMTGLFTLLGMTWQTPAFSLPLCMTFTMSSILEGLNRPKAGKIWNNLRVAGYLAKVVMGVQMAARWPFYLGVLFAMIRQRNAYSNIGLWIDRLFFYARP